MSKTKILDEKATQCAEEIIKDIYRECDWALSGDEMTQLLEDTDFNDAHSYMMKLVASKVASRLLVEKAD
tara:strand:+ start:103 stop:312 length:210 start_codon:yes stop_codon:yes gene_type:complete